VRTWKGITKVLEGKQISRAPNKASKDNCKIGEGVRKDGIRNWNYPCQLSQIISVFPSNTTNIKLLEYYKHLKYFTKKTAF